MITFLCLTVAFLVVYVMAKTKLDDQYAKQQGFTHKSRWAGVPVYFMPAEEAGEMPTVIGKNALTDDYVFLMMNLNILVQDRLLKNEMVDINFNKMEEL